MRVLITGGAGFIGARLASLLKQRGAAVSVWDVADTPGACGVDVLDRQAVLDGLGDVEVVYHLAGPVARTAEAEPYRASHLQLLGTLNLLDTLCRSRTRRFVLASSAHVYEGIDPEARVTETTPLAPAGMSLLGVLKYASELLARQLLRDSPVRCCVARIGSVFGAGVGSNVVNSFFESGIRSGFVEVWGDGGRKNQYTYLDDVVEGLALLAEGDVPVVNLAAPEWTRTVDLADAMCAEFGFERKLLPERRERVQFPYLGSEIARTELGWRTTPLLEALHRTAADLAIGCQRGGAT